MARCPVMGCERPVGLGGRTLAREAAVLAAFFPVFERGGDLAPNTPSEDFRTVVDEGRGLFGQVHDRAHGVARGHIRGKQVNDWRKSAATLCADVAASDPEWFSRYWDDVAERGLKVPKPVLQIIKSSGVDVAIDAAEDDESTEEDEFVLESSNAVASTAPKSPKVEVQVPKPDVPKAEVPAPTADVATAEVAEAEAPRAGAPRPEVPRAEAPKPEVPAVEVAKTETPKAEEPKVEAPAASVELPRPEIPVAVDIPRPDPFDVEKPEAVAPKAEDPQTDVPEPVNGPEAGAPRTTPVFRAGEIPEAVEVAEVVEAPSDSEGPKEEAPSPVPAPKGLKLIYGTAVGWVETKALEVLEGSFELDALGVTFTPGLDDSEYGAAVRYPWSSFLGVQVIATGPEDPLLTPHARVLDETGVGVPEEMIVAFAEVDPSDDRLLAIIPSSSSTVRKWLQRLDDAHVKIQASADPLPDCFHRTTPRSARRGGPVRLP